MCGVVLGLGHMCCTAAGSPESRTGKEPYLDFDLKKSLFSPLLHYFTISLIFSKLSFIGALFFSPDGFFLTSC